MANEKKIKFFIFNEKFYKKDYIFKKKLFLRFLILFFFFHLNFYFLSLEILTKIIFRLKKKI
jgi:hypothetical protein